MRAAISFVLVLSTVQAVAAGTFIGNTMATFRVVETLDGTTTTSTKSGPLSVSLTTDYSTMRWTMNWNVNLVMSGGPSVSFETDLAASGSVTSRRCLVVSGFCTPGLSSAGDPSPLSFPDATGKSGAGSYILYGDAAWSLTDRIVSSTRTRTSPSKLIVASGGASYYGNPYNADEAFSPGNQYLGVANYPPNVVLTHGMNSYSASEDLPNQWHINSSYPFTLGQWTNGTNNTVEVTISGFPTTFTMAETPAGDFTSNGIVDASDYVLWRKSPGILAPSLTSYSVWRANFNGQANGIGTNIPETVSLAQLLFTPFAMVRSRKNNSARAD